MWRINCEITYSSCPKSMILWMVYLDVYGGYIHRIPYMEVSKVMGIPPVSIHLNRAFPYQPSSYQGPPIDGNLHMLSVSDPRRHFCRGGYLKVATGGRMKPRLAEPTESRKLSQFLHCKMLPCKIPPEAV